MKNILQTVFVYGFGLFAILAVLAIPVGGLYESGRSIFYLTKYEHNTGKVTRCESRRFKKRTKYAPVVVTESGLRIKARWYGSKESCRENIGQNVSVLIDPENPDHGVLNTFVERWMLASILLGITSLFFFGYLRKL